METDYYAEQDAQARMDRERQRHGTIQCGNCKSRHHTVATVRLCIAGLVGRCEWVLEEDSEDGPIGVLCGATEFGTARGTSCEAGHEHVFAETREHEGWDYAADDGDARTLASRGKYAMAMDGSGAYVTPAPAAR